LTVRRTDTTSVEAFPPRHHAALSAIGHGVIGAPHICFAQIIRARISIVAVYNRATDAHPLYALVIEGAGIGAVAEEALVTGNERALSSSRVAVGLEAEGVLVLGVGTGHNSIWVDGALVGKAVRVTDEGAIAHITIFKLPTVGIFQALTVYRCSGTPILSALVTQRAGASIITRVSVGRILATTCFSADIICAGVTIVTFYGVTDTGPSDAVVSNSAGVTIFAGTRIKNLVDAPFISHAFVFGAIVVIVAEIDVVALDQIRLIDFIVAVLIHAIALFHGRFGSVASRESVLGTCSLTRTASHLGNGSAGSGQPQCHRTVGAGALTRVVDALLQVAALDCRHLLAGEPPGATLTHITRPSAEVAVVAIIDAGIVGATNTFTVIIGRAGPAQVGVTRYADVDHVRVSTRHLVAGPTGGTLFLACLGADSFPEMLHTPARLAVLIVVALVEEAAFTWVTLKWLNVSRIGVGVWPFDVQNIWDPGTYVREEYFSLPNFADVGTAYIGRCGRGTATS